MTAQRRVDTVSALFDLISRFRTVSQSWSSLNRSHSTHPDTPCILCESASNSGWLAAGASVSAAARQDGGRAARPTLHPMRSVAVGFVDRNPSRRRCRRAEISSGSSPQASRRTARRSTPGVLSARRRPRAKRAGLIMLSMERARLNVSERFGSSLPANVPRTARTKGDVACGRDSRLPQW